MKWLLRLAVLDTIESKSALWVQKLNEIYTMKGEKDSVKDNAQSGLLAQKVGTETVTLRNEIDAFAEEKEREEQRVNGINVSTTGTRKTEILKEIRKYLEAILVGQDIANTDLIRQVTIIGTF